jgi:hypothetical protein
VQTRGDSTHATYMALVLWNDESVAPSPSRQLTCVTAVPAERRQRGTTHPGQQMRVSAHVTYVAWLPHSHPSYRIEVPRRPQRRGNKTTNDEPKFVIRQFLNIRKHPRPTFPTHLAETDHDRTRMWDDDTGQTTAPKRRNPPKRQWRPRKEHQRCSTHNRQREYEVSNLSSPPLTPFMQNPGAPSPTAMWQPNDER